MCLHKLIGTPLYFWSNFPEVNKRILYVWTHIAKLPWRKNKQFTLLWLLVKFNVLSQFTENKIGNVNDCSELLSIFIRIFLFVIICYI